MVRPGERIATDGIVGPGEAAWTRPRSRGIDPGRGRSPGTDVSGGSINTTGVLEVEATAAGTDNSLTTIVELVEQAQARRATVPAWPTGSPARWCPAC